MQGYLFRYKKQFFSMFSSDLWESLFFVLTNVGILVFADDNFLNPTRLIPLGKLKVSRVAKKFGKREHVFKLSLNEEEIWTLAAADRGTLDLWVQAISETIDYVARCPKEFLLK